jgi:predicted AlkP superfamily pyrophosphatase or phosphodiesterase
MTIRKTLPLFTLSLLAACGSSNGSGAGATGEATATLGQAETASSNGQGDNGQGDNGQGDDGQGDDQRIEVKHIVLISVDGFHETDFARFIADHPSSTLAQLAARGVEYTDAHTTTPSDSFPGMTALVTGATPKSSGVYYDDSYDRTLFSPSSGCAGNPGTEVVMDESIEQDDSQLFSPINPANLPMAKDDHGNCKPVFPHEFIHVNTVFEVIRAAGRHTAWSDKHPAYDLLNGPSGKGIEDLYTPEVNSLVKNGGTANGVNLTAALALCDGTTNSLPLSKVSDYTTCEPTIMAYDDTHVQAVINWIDGKTGDGTKSGPVPTIMGMNMQQVSVGEKLPVGGYTDAAGTPSALLEGAFEHVDSSLGRIVKELKARHLYESTLIIVSAKHGQSPIELAKLHMEAGGHGTPDVTDPLGFINTVDANVDQVFSTYTNPNSGNAYAVSGHLQTDDVGIVWLQNQSADNISGVVAALESNAAAIHADVFPPGTIFTANINSGAELAAIYGDPTSGDPIAAARAPNAFIQPNWGVIYSGSSKKIAEHGGGSLDDTNVALLVSNPGLHHKKVTGHVTTTQVAPTILKALDLDPDALDGVRKEGTVALPGLHL